MACTYVNNLQEIRTVSVQKTFHTLRDVSISLEEVAKQLIVHFMVSIIKTCMDYKSIIG